MIPTLFMKDSRGFVIPEVNPESAWVFEAVSIAREPQENGAQYSDVQVLDLHELSVTDGFAALKRVLAFMPVGTVVFEHLEDGRLAQIDKTDFNYE